MSKIKVLIGVLAIVALVGAAGCLDAAENSGDDLESSDGDELDATDTDDKGGDAEKADSSENADDEREDAVDSSDDERDASGEDATISEPETSEDILKLMQTAYDELDTLQATVVQETRFDDEEHTTTQELVIEYPDQARITTDNEQTGEESVQIIDGTTSLTYFVDSNEYHEFDSGAGSIEYLDHSMLLDDLEELSPELVGTETRHGHDTYRLEVEADSFPDEEADDIDELTLRLWVDSDHWVILEYQLDVHADDDALFGDDYAVHVTYEDLVVNEEIDEEIFEFDVPEDAEDRMDPDFQRYENAAELTADADMDVTLPETLASYEFEDGNVFTFEGEQVSAEYTDGTSYLSVSVAQSENQVIIDEENAETVTVGDREATLETTDEWDFSTLVFECDDLTYTLSGMVEGEELITLAEKLDC